MFRACEEQQRGHVALVTGAVGSGKTSLLESFGEWTAGSRGQVMSATGSRAERGLHLGVVGQLFHSARPAPEAAAHVESCCATPPPRCRCPKSAARPPMETRPGHPCCTASSPP
ncbi:hypothetical protein V2I01_31465 [Micromonospora sp. BRA006-A]|nr:hypothetical protein [Micromonospora sp. BRA006-A]